MTDSRAEHRRRSSLSGSGSGATLPELLVAIALVGLLCVLGSLALPRLAASARLAAATTELAATLRLARGLALSRGVSVELAIAPDRRRYEVLPKGAAGGPRRSLPAGLRFAALPRRGAVVFYPDGSATNVTIVVGDGAGSERLVVVNQRGRVRVE